MQEACSEISMESGKALKELGMAIKTMTRPSFADTQISSSKATTKSLKSLLQSTLQEESNLLKLIPARTVASLLTDIVDHTQKIAESVNELASVAHFGTAETLKSPKKSQTSNGDQCAEPAPKNIDNPHVISITEKAQCTNKK